MPNVSDVATWLQVPIHNMVSLELVLSFLSDINLTVRIISYFSCIVKIATLVSNSCAKLIIIPTLWNSSKAAYRVRTTKSRGRG